MPTPLDPQTQVFLEEAIRLTARGYEPDRVAREMDMDVATITGLMALPQFAEHFQRVDPEKYKSWTEARMAQLANQRVRTLARNDAVEHYMLLRELVRNSTELRESERASVLEKLIKMSGLLDDEVHEEIVHLAPSQIANINAAYNEVSGGNQS